MERESEEKSVANDSKQSNIHSVHSNWSGMVLVDMEVEYRRLYRSRKRLDATTSTATPLAAPATKAVTIPLSSPDINKTIKNIVLVPYTPRSKDWGS